MNERLFFNNQPISKPARDVSNILYGEMRKHEANRYLIYVFDEENEFEFDQDFTIAAQERNNGISSSRKCLKMFLPYEKSKYKWTQESHNNKIRDIQNLRENGTGKENLGRSDIRRGCCHLETGDNAAAAGMANEEGLFQTIFSSNQLD